MKTNRCYKEFFLDNEVKIGVTYDYYPASPDVWYLSNGDPGYPGSPAEVEIESIDVIEGKLVDLLYEAGTVDSWWDWLEGKIYEAEE